jgi:hypothetical protein
VRRLSAGALAALAAGCSEGPVDDLQTAALFVPPNGSLQGLQIVVPRGRALAFVAQPLGEEGETLKTRIRLESADGSVAVAEPTIEMNQFVVLGLNVGTTTLRVTDESGGDATPTLRVEVVSP